MVAMRRSPATEANPALTEAPARPGETNVGWLERLRATDGIILLGGSSLSHFRVRVAQSHLRSDMLPSLWSLCGIMLPGSRFASVPLEVGSSVSSVPRTNGVRITSLGEYDDPERFPNVAVIRFAEIHDRAHEDIDAVSAQRSIIDLPALVVPWLGYIWSTPGATNPLLDAIGLPSAAFVETVFAMSGFELTPGLSSSSSCPEAIWQSAKWWSAYYEGAAETSSLPHARSMVPAGVFVTRQPAAAVVNEPAAPVRAAKPARAGRPSPVSKSRLRRGRR